MKRQTYIIMLALAAFMLLTGPFIAHHHHGHVLCTVVAHCDSDNTDNDEHTGHHGDHSPCVEKQGAVVAKSAVGHTEAAVKWLPHLAAACLSVATEPHVSSCMLRMHHHIVFYRQAAFVRLFSLRAPPCAAVVRF